MLDIEMWSAVPGYEGSYEVSNQGRVRSLDRNIQHSNESHPRFLRGSMLRSRIDRDGYALVDLYANKKKRTFKVHHLVLTVFGSLPNDSQSECDHKDGNRSNNCISNLRWATKSLNRKALHSCRGESGIRGVRFRPSKANPWQAYYNNEGRFHSLGHFATLGSAEQARLKYEDTLR